MIVSYAALTHRLKVDPASEGLFAIYLTTGEQFYGKQPPRLFNRDRQPMPLQSIPVGSEVRLHFDKDGWIDAVQILSLVDDCPF